MNHQWIDTRLELPKVGEPVFVHSGDNTDAEFPQVGFWSGIAWHKNAGERFADIAFWMSRDALPVVPSGPGSNVFRQASALAWHLEGLKTSDLEISKSWYTQSQTQGVKHLSGVLPGNFSGWTDPVALAELNIWNKGDKPRYPAELDLLVEATNLETGERECFSRNEWTHPETIHLSEVMSTIRGLRRGKKCRDGLHVPTSKIQLVFQF